MSERKPKGHGKKAALGAGAASPLAIALLSSLHSTAAPAPPPPTPVKVVVVNAPAAPPVAVATPVPGAPPAAAPATVTPPARFVSDMKPEVCLQHFAGIDLPRQRGDQQAANETMVCHRTYVLSYNVGTHNPDWVLEHLAPGDLTGPAMRKDNFRQDKAMNGIDPDLLDYSDPGPIAYDRGHQAPAGDAKFSDDAMSTSFFLYNMAPQVGIGFNRGVWKYLEESVRAWVLCGGHDDLFVITGPIYDPPLGTMGHDKVSVPRQFFKIVYDPKTDRAVGFVLPNVKIGSRIDNLQIYVQPIADIETETGLNFFAGRTIRDQTMLEASKGTAWGHIGPCKGDSGD